MIAEQQTAKNQSPTVFGSDRTGPRSRILWDYVALTKPWIVALLLTTTLAAMLIAARGLPPLPILIITLLCGACAAGGANALNSYNDRETDKVMVRTARRPLPSGRIPPQRALLFALSLCGLSQILLAAFVNLLSAGLALVGIIYYAWIYTVLLKRATPQNIVVGGVAGAIPPLVGWAAVTNDLSLLSLYLFAIILLWTPPHTWALMLLLDRDYKRARIPMLPTAWGEVEARRQIFLYSIQLVVITLIPFSIGALGISYLAGAMTLGAYFLMLAVALWRNGTKAEARRLYKYSNYYLAALFFVMVVDRWRI
jgi:heme o synthase